MSELCSYLFNLSIFLFPIIIITPNNPFTKIGFSVASEETERSLPVKLKVYDMFGNEIITLVNEERLSGNYEVEFKAENLTCGIYIYMLKSVSFIETNHLTVARSEWY